MEWARTVSPPPFPHRPAQFTSRCPWCSDSINEDDDIIFLVEGEWVCEECARSWANGLDDHSHY